MDFITYLPNDPSAPKEAAQAFREDADIYIVQRDCHAALWWSHTPQLPNESVGCIGACILSDTKQSILFLQTCSKILQQKKCSLIIGPMNGNTWRSHRVISGGSDKPAFFLEPTPPSHWLNTFLSAGFEVYSEYTSSLVSLDQNFPSFKSHYQRLSKQSITIETLELANFQAELSSIYHLSAKAFTQNVLYTPITEEQFCSQYKKVESLIDPELVLLAKLEDQLLGYLFCLPNLLAKQNNRFPDIILKTLATKSDSRCAGLGTLLVDTAHETAQKKGYKSAIHALQHKSNSSQRLSQRFHPNVFREYAILSKHL